MQLSTRQPLTSHSASQSFLREKVSHSFYFLVTYQHEVFKEAIRFLIKDQFPDAHVVFVKRQQDLFIQLSAHSFDILCLDIDIDEREYSPHWVSELKESQPALKIMILSDLDERIYRGTYLQAGASGFLSKRSQTEQVMDMMNRLLNHQEDAQETAFTFLQDSHASIHPLDKLSAREREIVQWLVKGYSLIAISKFLDLNETTISTYKQRIFKKTGVSSLPDLIYLYHRYAH
jgi:DNA-binding NarL/FixJ family response regulator